MRIFRRIIFDDNATESGQSPFRSFSTNAAKMLLMLALFFIGIGILVMIFPEVLAFFVALLFFMAAFVCLGWAWRIFRGGRGAGRDPIIHMDVNDVDDCY